MPDDKHTQFLAYLLVITGLVATGVGDWHSWHTLANGGTTAIGFGGGILTGNKLANVLNTKGGTINATQAPPETQS